MRSISKVFVPYLIGTNHPGIVSISVAVGALINLLIILILLPILGIMGAAIALVIGYFFSSIILLISFLRLSGISLFKTFRFRISDWDIITNSFIQYFAKYSVKSK